jgi:hypothetical protein
LEESHEELLDEWMEERLEGFKGVVEEGVLEY